MGEAMDARRQLETRGWTIRRSVFSPNEVADFRAKVAEALDDARRRQTVLVEDGAEGRVEWCVGDLLSYDELGAIILDERVVRFAQDLLGERPIYFADSTLRLGANGERAWHRDNIDRDFDGPDWKGDYPIIRIGIYLQDHATHSGGLTIADGSHKEAAKKGHGRFPDIRPGDVAGWSLRARHSTEAVRIRMMPNLVLNPRLQTRIPKWARVPDDELRMTLFASFARHHTLFDRYVDYLKTRDYFQESEAASRYSPQAHRLLESSGIEIGGAATEIAQRV
jgi:hypothetical protein